jgi:hypothetical protein
LRIYKKSLFWVIVTNREADNYDNSNNFSTSEIENKLKNVEFSDIRKDEEIKKNRIQQKNKIFEEMQIKILSYKKDLELQRKK